MEISRAVSKDVSEERDPNAGPYALISAGRSARRGRVMRRPELWAEPPARAKKKAVDPDAGDDDAPGSGERERGESRGGDLFQLYLHQMTEIRLLPREEELWLAKQIDHHRKRLRAKLFESPVALAEVLPILEGLENGSLIPTRIIVLEDPRDLKVTLSRAVESVRRILRDCAQGHPAFHARRQRQCTMLLERLGIDLRKLIPMIHRLVDLSRRYDELE